MQVPFTYTSLLFIRHSFFYILFFSSSLLFLSYFQVGLVY